jgi:ATP-dependent DNA helicase RecG
MNPANTRQSPLDTPAEFLKGVGPRRAEALRSMNIETLQDVLEFRPRRYLDHSDIRYIRDINPDEDVTVMGEIISRQLIRFGKRRLVVRIHDGSGILEAVWFNQTEIFARIFSEQQMVAFSGKVTRYKHWQMVHPDFDILSEKREQLHTGQLIPIYPSNQEFKKAGLSNYSLRRILSQAVQKYGNQIPETLPEYLVKRYRLMSRRDAYQQMHFPESTEKLHQVARRFKYEELFYLQLLMALRKYFYYSPVVGLHINVTENLLEASMQSLPFTLTGAQKRVLREIQNDLQSGHPMSRLVQGDVGSGKTVVALVGMQMAISAGYQAALMAPTEILAQQHYFNIRNLLNDGDIKTALLIGSLPASGKKALQRKIARGEVDLAIGTHALIQEGVQFPQLGFVVIDEQHRFGVMQRSNLVQKGQTPHVLVMTATPIPRTLAMTIYGDLDVSIIDELPPGRREIRTYWRTEERLNLVYDFIRERLSRKEQVYVVYPLIEESEKLDLKAATEAYHHLQKEIFPDFRLELLHGRLKMADKERIMQNFKQGATDMLISTTVIEVGVDVPNATIMMIEHAERFGLSQLHQLRGRVGRGSRQSYCILITPPDINEVARQRMEVMTKTNDGFVIAEEDLRLRGSGEFFGTRQHGIPDLKYVDLVTDQNIVQTARKDAFAMVEKDPHLRLPEHANIRIHFKNRFVDKFQMANIA